jgi:hypothetical protein
MRCRRLVKTLLGSLVLFILGGCKTEPAIQEVEVTREKEVVITRVPLTFGIIDRLKVSLDKQSIDILKDCQLYISSYVILERYDIKREDILNNGKPNLTDIYTRIIKEINALTPGIARDIGVEGGERIIKVGFEQRVEANLLEFAQKEAEGYFYLKYTPHADGTPAAGDEKGTISYGGGIYKVKYAERPYLLIEIDQKYQNALDSQKIRGWNYESSPSPPASGGEL